MWSHPFVSTTPPSAPPASYESAGNHRRVEGSRPAAPSRGPFGVARRRLDRRRPGPIPFLRQQASLLSPACVLPSLSRRNLRRRGRPAAATAPPPRRLREAPMSSLERPTSSSNRRSRGGGRFARASGGAASRCWPPRPASKACPNGRYSIWPSLARLGRTRWWCSWAQATRGSYGRGRRYPRWRISVNCIPPSPSARSTGPGLLLNDSAPADLERQALLTYGHRQVTAL